MEAYGDDLAYIHDAGHGDFARRAAPGLLAILRRSGITTGLAVDLGCGSGIWARELLHAGYHVLGIDLSAAMIRLARKRAPGARFRRASLLRVKLPRCDVVTALGECFNYLFDARNSLMELRRLFRRVHDALKPGGVLIFDVAEPGRGRGRRQRHRQGADWAVLVEVTENQRTRRLTRRITAFRKVGRLYRRDQEIHHLRLYRGAEIAGALRRAGFRVRTLAGYGRMRFDKGLVGFLARKM